MKLFDKLWKKIVIGALACLVLTASGLFGYGKFVYEQDFYSEEKGWTVFKGVSDDTNYCYAWQHFENGTVISISFLEYGNDTGSGHILSVISSGPKHEPFDQTSVLVILTDESFDPNSATNMVHGKGLGIVSSDGRTIVTRIPVAETDGKDFWSAIKHTRTIIVGTPSGQLFLGVPHIRDALVKVLECETVSFNMDANEKS